MHSFTAHYWLFHMNASIHMNRNRTHHSISFYSDNQRYLQNHTAQDNVAYKHVHQVTQTSHMLASWVDSEVFE